MTRITDDIDLIDKIMIERLQDGCADFCDNIRVTMRDLVNDENSTKWWILMSDVEDLAAGLRVLSSYGVVDWFPEIPQEMMKPKLVPKPKRKRKKK